MSCIFSADHASYVDCILSCMCRGEYRVLILVSGFLRLDRVPQACRKVRTRSTTSVRLLHGVILLPSGISGKMIISLDTIIVGFASCCASCGEYRELICVSGFPRLDRVPQVCRMWGPVRLHRFVCFTETFFFQAGSQARWPFPQIPLPSLPC